MIIAIALVLAVILAAWFIIIGPAIYRMQVEKADNAAIAVLEGKLSYFDWCAEFEKTLTRHHFEALNSGLVHALYIRRSINQPMGEYT